MFFFGDLGNMIEMLSIMGSSIDILSCIKVVFSPLSPSEVCQDQIKMRLKRERERKSKKEKFLLEIKAKKKKKSQNSDNKEQKKRGKRGGNFSILIKLHFFYKLILEFE